MSAHITAPSPLPLDRADEHELLRRAADLGLRYLSESRDASPYPPEAAIARARQARVPLPRQGADPKAVLDELAAVYGEATVRTHSGRYFGFVHGSSFPIGMAAKWLSTVWDQNTPLYALSPATALLEAQVEEWLVSLLGLPVESAVGFVSSTSQSLLTAAFVARQTLLARQGWDARTRGLRTAPTIRVVVGEQAHGAVGRALMIAGVGTSELEVVPADAAGRLQPSHLPSLDRRTLLILQAGNIYTGAFDAFAEIVPAARRAGAWVHVDGAFGLWAAASPSTRALTAGIDQADSWSADCHKTLNTPYSCGLFICRDREAVQTAMASQGSYLSLDDQRNGMDYSPDMARRCFAAEVWATLKFLGRDGVATLVETLVDRARAIARGLEASGYIVMNDVVFNQVTVRLDDDAQTETALGHLQCEGRAWCSGGSWLGHRVIRISVSSWRTTPTDVTATIEAFDRARLVAAG